MEQDRKRRQPELTRVVHRNIEALLEFRHQTEREQRVSARMARRIAGFLGSLWSALAHSVAFALWFAINTGRIPGVTPFDPPPFVALAVAASLESILLTTFVLVSQNQFAWTERRQSDLDLQVNLLAEHEITHLLHLTEAIARRLDVPVPPHLEELKQEVNPEKVLAEIATAERKTE